MTLQEELNLIKSRYNLSYSWIASELGVYPQKIQYLFEVAKFVPFDMYSRIMDLFERHGYVMNSGEACENLIDTTMETNRKIGQALAELNRIVRAYTEDNRFDPGERKKARLKFIQLKQSIDKIMEQLISITDEA